MLEAIGDESPWLRLSKQLLTVFIGQIILDLRTGSANALEEEMLLEIDQTSTTISRLQSPRTPSEIASSMMSPPASFVAVPFLRILNSRDDSIASISLRFALPLSSPHPPIATAVLNRRARLPP